MCLQQLLACLKPRAATPETLHRLCVIVALRVPKPLPQGPIPPFPLRCGAGGPCGTDGHIPLCHQFGVPLPKNPCLWRLMNSSKFDLAIYKDIIYIDLFSSVASLRAQGLLWVSSGAAAPCCSPSMSPLAVPPAGIWDQGFSSSSQQYAEDITPTLSHCCNLGGSVSSSRQKWPISIFHSPFCS